MKLSHTHNAHALFSIKPSLLYGLKNENIKVWTLRNTGDNLAWSNDWKVCLILFDNLYPVGFNQESHQNNTGAETVWVMQFYSCKSRLNYLFIEYNEGENIDWGSRPRPFKKVWNNFFIHKYESFYCSETLLFGARFPGNTFSRQGVKKKNWQLKLERSIAPDNAECTTAGITEFVNRFLTE